MKNLSTSLFSKTVVLLVSTATLLGLSGLHETNAKDFEKQKVGGERKPWVKVQTPGLESNTRLDVLSEVNYERQANNAKISFSFPVAQEIIDEDYREENQVRYFMVDYHCSVSFQAVPREETKYFDGLQELPRWLIEPVNRTIECSPETGLKNLVLKKFRGGETVRRISRDPIKFELSLNLTTSLAWQGTQGYHVDSLKVSLANDDQASIDFDFAIATAE